MTFTANLSSQFPLIPGYTIGEQLYRGDRTSVYRATAAVDGRSVIIKLLHQTYPSFNDLLQFRHQYTLATNLQIPNVVRPISLQTYGNSYLLIVEDSGSISLQQYCRGRALSVGETLTIAIAIAAILQDLHQATVVHKDIKPANILIQPQSHQIQLIDLSISSLLPKETPALKPPNWIEGTLAYLAPEQTGRMNRGIDYRTDFYSLGVTLYELLTGELPFQSDDLLELVYCHIAQNPVPIATKQPQVPMMVAEIVAKLMSKNAEQRYQSAIGLQSDLQICLEQWEATGAIAEFRLGMRDLSDRFTIPECLYGRELAVETLLQSFDRVAAPPDPLNQRGKTELILITGASGIGKTAVVNEVHKPITRQHGYFIKGKFDQFNRNLPLSGFVRALRDLVWQLLSQSDTQLDCQKLRLQAALGENAGVMLEVIPELEQIIGAQPPAIELSGTEAQHRFNLLFQNFIGVFATLEHPLTIFLDDLQWADPASLQAIQSLLDGSAASHLLLIGAYRDNEVSPAHPLMLTLAEIAKTQPQLTTIALQPLTIADLDRLVSATLGCPERVARPLTELIYQNTQGNPFFATQLLKAWHQEQWITFDRHAGHWQCDLARVRVAALSADVVEFMALQLLKLSPATQLLLKLAACIGDSWDLATLAIVADCSAAAVTQALWPALQAGLLVPQNEVYKFFGNILVTDDIDRTQGAFAVEQTAYRFLHDRVQQAAYSLIPTECRQLQHLQIGRLLLAQIGDLDRGVKLFDAVNHLNLGRAAIVDPSERTTLAQLNLATARRARLSTAYQAALDYAHIGIELLDRGGWYQHYATTLVLHHVAAETAFLQRDFDRATELVATVIDRARTVLDRVPVYETQIQLLTSQQHYERAIKWGLQILAELGIKIPIVPQRWQLLGALVKTQLLVRGKSIAAVLQLPAMADPQSIAAMRILDLLSHPAYHFSKPLLGLMAFVGVEQSLLKGNSIWSARLYSLYSVVLADLQDFPASYRMGQLALQLFDRLPNPAIEAKVKFDAAFFSQPCHQAARDSLPLHRSAIQAAIASGDLVYAGLCYYGDCAARMNLGEQLGELLVVSAAYRQAVAALKDRSSLFLIDILDRLLQRIHRPDLDPQYLFDTAANDLQAVATLEARDKTTNLSVFYAYKKYLCYVFEDIPSALKYADLYLPYDRGNCGPYASTHISAMEGLIRLAAYPTSSPRHQRQLLRRVAQIEKLLARRARFAPANVRSKCHLLAAERCRVLGKFTDAIESYDLAIATAEAANDLQSIARANELAAKFYLGWGKVKVAAGYMQMAYYHYGRWGATAKTTDLANRYPQLLTPILQAVQPQFDPLATLVSMTDSLTDRPEQSHQQSNYFDLASVLQSAQMLASTLDLQVLLAKLMQIILTNSGAETCILAMPTVDGEWLIHSIVSTNSPLADAPQLPQPLTADRSDDYPVNSIYWVRNTKQVLAIDAAQPLEIPDRYLQKHQSRSVLCLPILKQAAIFGVLYLEHRQVPQMFTRERKIVITFLCAQAAIALENAKLYHEAQAATAKLQLQQHYLETVLDNIPHLVWLKDECGRYIAANRAAGNFVGCDASELIGKNDYELLPVEIARKCIADDMLVIASGERSVVECEILTATNEIRWLESIKTPIKNSDGNITGTVGISLDITDRKAMQQELRQSQQQYQHLSDNIPGIIYQLRMTPAGKITYPYVSSGCLELLEISAAEIVDDPHCLLDLIHPDDRSIAKQLLVDSARDLQPKSCEGRAILPSGAVKWVKSVSRPELQADGSIVWDGVMLDITDRKHIEQALLESQSNYRKVTENVPGAIYQLRMAPDGNLSYPYISSGCQDLFGISPAMVSDDITCLINLVDPADFQKVMQDIAESARTFSSKLCEFRVVLASGVVKWIKSVSRPELQADGAIVWDGVMMDITDRKHIEQALSESQSQYQRLADNIPGAIYQFRLAPDGSSSIPYMSSGCQELLELAPAEIVADFNHLIRLTHPEDLPSFYQAVADSARDRSFFTWEGRTLLASGQVKWIELASRPALQPDGAIVWDGVMLDITDRKQAELNLAASQQKYYSLIQAIPGVVWEYNFVDDRFSFVNDRAEALLGYPLEAWLSQKDFWANRLHPDDRDDTIQAYSDAIDNRQICEAEYRLIAADGRIVWVYDIATPMLGANGNLIATTGLLVDITDKQAALQDRQQAELALQETNNRLASTNQELRRATQLKDEFLATMSHELRTPLNAILGMSECLEEGVFGAINERQTKSIETIHRSGQHLLSLINDILDVSKIVAGKLELEFMTVSIRRLCDSSVALVKQQANLKQIQLHTDLPAQLGTICVDERRMRQVAINLLANAIKFTPRGGSIVLAVEFVAADDPIVTARQLAAIQTGTWACISVTDTGIGIAPADRDRLFEPFVQIDSSLNRQYEGTGLGLALVKQMVELHSGFVTLDSEVGRGSCFRVYLPSASGDRQLLPASTGVVPAADFNFSGVDIGIPTTILLAEDNQTNAITFVSYLNAKGYRTLVAKNGTEAIELTRAHHPDLILMDIQMPGMDGIEAIAYIRQQPQLADIPIVALTALAMESDREKCLAVGATQCLTKPIKLKELNRTIQQCLDSN